MQKNLKTGIDVPPPFAITQKLSWRFDYTTSARKTVIFHRKKIYFTFFFLHTATIVTRPVYRPCPLSSIQHYASHIKDILVHNEKVNVCNLLFYCNETRR